MFKVLFLSRFPPEKDGIADYCYELCNYLTKFIKVDVLTFGKGEIEKGKISVLRMLNNEGIASLKIIKEIAKEYDLVHFQTASFTYKRTFYLFSLLGINFVSTIHEVLGLRQFHYLPFVYPVYLNSKRIIMLSKIQAERLAKLKIRKNKIKMMKHGADIETFKPGMGLKIRKEKGLEDKFIFMTFGFIGKGKGQDLLIKAFASVAEELKDAVLVIAGGYRDEKAKNYFEYLKKLAKSLNISERVLFTGYIAKEELPFYISSCDVFILPYQGGTQPSGPLARALASGCAIIATKTPYFEEILRHGENAYLIENNLKELAKAMILLYKDDELREKLSRNARLFAEKSLDWNLIARETLKVYEEAMNS